jgi:hypothetical protein
MLASVLAQGGHAATVYVVHSTDDVITGFLVGAGTVLLGVLLAEVLGRARAKRERLEAAVFDLSMIVGPTMDDASHLSQGELTRLFSDLLDTAFRVRQLASFPVRRAKAVKVEAEMIITRAYVAVGRWSAGETGVPSTGPIIGDRLWALTFGEHDDFHERLDAELAKHGLTPARTWADGGATKINAPET